MQSKDAENSMTKLVQLLADIAEKGYADEMDSAPTSDFVKECWERLCEIYKDPEFNCFIVHRTVQPGSAGFFAGISG